MGDLGYCDTILLTRILHGAVVGPIVGAALDFRAGSPFPLRSWCATTRRLQRLRLSCSARAAPHLCVSVAVISCDEKRHAHICTIRSSFWICTHGRAAQTCARSFCKTRMGEEVLCISGRSRGPPTRPTGSCRSSMSFIFWCYFWCSSQLTGWFSVSLLRLRGSG